MLARRQARFFGARVLPVRKRPRAPSVPWSRQLGFRRRFMVVGHVDLDPSLPVCLFRRRGSIGVVPRTPKISSSTFAPARAAPRRAGRRPLQPDRQAGCREAAGQRQRRAAHQRDRVDDGEPLDIVVELLAGAFGDVAVFDREGATMVAGPATDRICSKNSSVRAVMATRCASARSSCSTVSLRPSSISRSPRA